MRASLTEKMKSSPREKNLGGPTAGLRKNLLSVRRRGIRLDLEGLGLSSWIDFSSEAGVRRSMFRLVLIYDVALSLLWLLAFGGSAENLMLCAALLAAAHGLFRVLGESYPGLFSFLVLFLSIYVFVLVFLQDGLCCAATGALALYISFPESEEAYETALRENWDLVVKQQEDHIEWQRALHGHPHLDLVPTLLAHPCFDGSSLVSALR